MSSHSNGRVALLFASGLLAIAPLEPAAAQCELDVVNASDAFEFDRFGRSIDMDGDFTIVGATGWGPFGRDLIPSYIFRRVGSSWVQDAILDPDDVSPRSRLGRSVAIHGDVAVAGAHHDGHSDSDPSDGPGSAYVYAFKGNTWVQEAKLAASDATMGNSFGRAVSVHGDRVVVGAIAPNRADDNAGSAYVFDREGPTWVERARLTATDAKGNDRFGASVELQEARAFVAATNRGHSGESTTDGMGAVYVFEFDGAQWVQEAILTVADLQPRDSFGAITRSVKH